MISKTPWRAEIDGDSADGLWSVKEGDLLVCDCTCEATARLIADLYNQSTVDR